MDFELDPSVTAIKELLNKEQIKLWLPPYHTDKEEQTKEEVEVSFYMYIRLKLFVSIFILNYNFCV